MFHTSNMGSHGERLPCDLNGFVPEASDDDPWAFTIDHGSERTHEDDGNLTEYGEWWEEEGFAAWRDDAVVATKKATDALSEWQTS
jgi:hypothetical protein